MERLRNRRGFASPLIGLAMLSIVFLGLGSAVSQSARFRALASRKEANADIAQRQLENLLNRAWTHADLSTAANPHSATVEGVNFNWSVEAVAGTTRLKKISLSLAQGTSIENISLTGYKYNDF